MSESPDLQQINLKALIGHATSVQAQGKLEDVYQLFEKCNIAFIAVLENERAIGMCSRSQIGMLLGSRHGFPLFSRKPGTRPSLARCASCVRSESDRLGYLNK